MSFHSDVWRSENETINYKKHPTLLQQRQELERPLLQLLHWTCHEQAKEGRVFLTKGPPSSLALREPEMKDILGMPNVVSDCVPINKADKCVTNSASLLEALKVHARNYDSHEPHVHEGDVDVVDRLA